MALITTSGTISGGLSGDGVTRANAITLLSGVHTLTLRTGASFVGNVVVDTAASSNPGVAASNTLNLDGASSGTLALQQFHNFGHLTQTGGTGGSWTLSGAGAFSNDATVSAGTMVLDAASTLTVPAVNLLSGGTLSANGTLNSSVNVGSGATLMGTGTVGTTTVANGGALAPGNSIGTLNVAGNVSVRRWIDLSGRGRCDRGERPSGGDRHGHAEWRHRRRPGRSRRLSAVDQLHHPHRGRRHHRRLRAGHVQSSPFSPLRWSTAPTTCC